MNHAVGIGFLSFFSQLLMVATSASDMRLTGVRFDPRGQVRVQVCGRWRDVVWRSAQLGLAETTNHAEGVALLSFFHSTYSLGPTLFLSIGLQQSLLSSLGT